jgi:hypothetical protein
MPGGASDAARDGLQRDRTAEPRVAREIDDAHAAAAHFALDLVRPDDPADQRHRRGLGGHRLGDRGRFEEGAVALVRGDEREDLAGDVGIGGGAREPRDAFGGRTGERVVEQRVDPGPLLAGHAPPSSFLSQARATIHERLTVAGDTPRTLAVSSIVSPPK